MTNAAEQLLQQALELPREDRVAMMEGIQRSLEGGWATDISPAWIEETQRRFEAYDKGLVQAIPAEEVFEDWDRD